MRFFRKILATILNYFSYLKWRKYLTKTNYKIISLGLGQQSTTLYLMSSTGYIERADFAIFSDTGAESKKTYQYLEWLKSWSRKHKGIPILHIGRKTIYRDLIRGTNKAGSRFASIPAFTKDQLGKIGILQRQCTEEYKTSEIFKTLRKLYRVKQRKRTPPTEIWLGITLEEMERMKYPRVNWMTFVYPFLNTRSRKSTHEKFEYTKLFRRSDCVSWLKERGFPIPPKSACIFCPFQSDKRWQEMKQNEPSEWKKCLRLDEQIRNSTKKGVKQPIYLHRSCSPLKDAYLKEDQTDLFSAECGGVCGI